MSDFIQQAKQAREILAGALRTLQSDPTVPPALMDVAEPVAMAMGALHAIERSGQLGTAISAKDNVRRALGLLQAQAGLQHPAVANAMESVASSLGIVFGLVKASESAQPAQPVQPAQPAQPIFQPAPVQQVQVQPNAATVADPFKQNVPQPAYQQAPAQPAYQQAPQPAYQQAPAQPAYQPAPQPVFQPVPVQQAPVQSNAVTVADPFKQNAPQQPAYQPAPQPVFQPVPAQRAPAQANPATVADPFATAVAPAPVKPRSSGPVAARFDVALGTNSTANFYKGLSGNDVIEHGGIFVATYNKLPPTGSTIALHIILPGGFEFESIGIIAWVRDSSSGESPGFGARFTQIDAEAKQLVYRYVRNREPLFYDDL